MQREQASEHMQRLLEHAHQLGASDLFVSAGFPPSVRCHGALRTLASTRLAPEVSRAYAMAIMPARQQEEFAKELECNFAIDLGFSRFRVNAYVQKQSVGMVIRRIPAAIPDFGTLKLPAIVKDIAMARRGLVFLVGSSGAGKSTTLAAMIEHRNRHANGHIVTVEDPIEYVYESKNCLITQREISIDTHSWHQALKNALRQSPDVILVGEIRDRDTMEQALAFAESGHLCLATLHAPNANQSFDRIINFFPEDRRQQLLIDLASNVHAIVAQRLTSAKDGSRRMATEILLNTPMLSEMILKGQFQSMKEYMSKSRELGMQTFDQSLLELYKEGAISFEEAMQNADSKNDVRISIRLAEQERENAREQAERSKEHLRRGAQARV